MKILFDSVLLKRAVVRLGGHQGLAASDTAHFSRKAGNVIELDTQSGLLTISKGDLSICVNREDCWELYPIKPAAE